MTIVRSRRFWKWLRTIVLLLLAITTIRSSLIDVNLVPSDSMVPTLINGDHIVVNKLAFDLKLPLTRLHLVKWGDPRRGDVIVFISPRDGLQLVKRVVAVGGDRVEIRSDRLTINDAECGYRPGGVDRAEATWIESGDGGDHSIRADVGNTSINRRSVTVPAGMFFVLGDHRDGCVDSRVFGPISRASVVGRVGEIAFSMDPNRWFSWRSGRAGLVIH